jgi:hypothetical protein
MISKLICFVCRSALPQPTLDSVLTYYVDWPNSGDYEYMADVLAQFVRIAETSNDKMSKLGWLCIRVAKIVSETGKANTEIRKVGIVCLERFVAQAYNQGATDGPHTTQQLFKLYSHDQVLKEQYTPVLQMMAIYFIK